MNRDFWTEKTCAMFEDVNAAEARQEGGGGRGGLDRRTASLRKNCQMNSETGNVGGEQNPA